MAALTDNRETGRADGVLKAWPVGAAKHIYRGSLVVTDTLLAEAATNAASKVFAGVAYEEADNTSGAASAINVRCYQDGVFTFGYTGTAPGINSKVFAADDQTVQIAVGTTPVYIGRCVDVNTTAATCDIRIDTGQNTEVNSTTLAGLKVVTGSVAVTGTLVVASGLTTVHGAIATLKDDQALTGMMVSATWAAANVTLKVWKATGAADCTPLAADAAKTVNYIIFGV